jgi:drug/metabolite transporter (DMT)-like permease
MAAAARHHPDVGRTISAGRAAGKPTKPPFARLKCRSNQGFSNWTELLPRLRRRWPGRAAAGHASGRTTRMIGLGGGTGLWSVAGTAPRGGRAHPARPGRQILTSIAAAQAKRRMTGLTITFFAALFVSLITTFARLAYEAGSNPPTQVFFRSTCMMLALGGLQLALGRSVMLPRRVIPATLGLAVCIFLMSFGYLSSVAYIKVSLAVLLLYTFPLMVGIASPLLGRERMTWQKALCLLGAFAGLVYASWGDFGTLDWRGIGFALTGAAGVAAISLFGGAAMAKAPPFAMNAWMNLWVVLALVVFLAVSGDFAPPQTTQGWLATAGVCVCYTLGILFLFLGLTYISPAQSALTMNLEPAFSTLAAILLLSEAVGVQQWIGMAILLMFLAISTLTGLPRREKA